MSLDLVLICMFALVLVFAPLLSTTPDNFGLRHGGYKAVESPSQQVVNSGL